MATFRVGMRVKKVRGEQPGITGVVSDVPVSSFNRLLGADLTVTVDAPAIDNHSGFRKPAGHVFATMSSDWEPILPQHEPCEEWFRTCDLDALLQREPVRE